MTSQDDIGKDFEGRNALVAEYVLGVLPSAEHARIGRLIDNDQSMRAERDFWTARFAALNDAYAETPVPGHLYSAIEARAFGDRINQAKSPWWDSLLVWRGIAAGAVAIAVAALGFSLLQPRPDVGALTTQLVAALEQEGSDVKFVALYDGSGNVRLTALSGSAVPEKDYELWAIQGEDSPVSMGVIPAAERSAVEISPQILANWGEGSILAITLEPEGGAPDGVPTGPVIAKGAVTRI